MADEDKKGKSVAQTLYAEAEKRLRIAHKEEFEAILTGLYEEKGLTRSKRLTAEERAAKVEADRQAREAAKVAAAREKALAAARALAAEYPDLVQVADAPAVPGAEGTPF